MNLSRPNLNAPAEPTRGKRIKKGLQSLGRGDILNRRTALDQPVQTHFPKATARMCADDSQRKILSRKEVAKEMRRSAYQRAKEHRAKDPRFIAMKEAAKEQRRAAYQKVKEKRKSEQAASKASAKEKRGSRIAEERAESQARALQQAKRLMRTADESAATREQKSQSRAQPSDRGQEQQTAELGLAEGSWMVKGSNVEN